MPALNATWKTQNKIVGLTKVHADLEAEETVEVLDGSFCSCPHLTNRDGSRCHGDSICICISSADVCTQQMQIPSPKPYFTACESKRGEEPLNKLRVGPFYIGCVGSFFIPETKFVVVTEYESNDVKREKIKLNPCAKRFREDHSSDWPRSPLARRHCSDGHILPCLWWNLNMTVYSKLDGVWLLDISLIYLVLIAWSLFCAHACTTSTMSIWCQSNHFLSITELSH
ncbi:unnamed protein product [Mesocestoides corti]|uniref:T-box domain-containing protein n=1 Tax=Mesocestoides corti TaxID=53468 RepID=A0A0R3UPF7_MESCO|nr:unnamed protein product [Mesocestoides corti]